MNSQESFDVIVIGSGAAGTSAAVSACETAKDLGKTLKVGIVERGDESAWGGNSRWTTANFQMTKVDQVNPTLYEDLLEDSQGRMDKEYASIIVKEAAAAVGWVCGKGVVFEKLDLPTSRPRMAPVGGGYAVIAALRSEAEKLGVSVLLESTAFKFSQNDDGKIDGIWVRHRDGKTERLASRATILAGGGFEGNLEMLTRYISKEATSVRWEVPGTKMHMGECINMALEAGAAPSGEYSGFHGFAVDVRSDSPAPPPILGLAYGILVNIEGVRFTDEGVPFDSLESISRNILQQPLNRAFLIMDHKARSLPNFDARIGGDIPPIEAASLEELSKLIHVPSDTLLDTVKKFNVAVQTTEPTKLDEMQTTGIFPRKSSRALSIDRAPYYCYPVGSTVEFTWGGIATDTRARVLATNDAPIPGLYAAGEMVGLNYHHYTGGSSVMRSLVFGRIAGSEAVKQVAKEP
ncbi:MAG: FAD-binding protein [Thaumarchaeota archaeon]|nr:FAD-binding protein [Nitrososphaerota archaeon]